MSTLCDSKSVQSKLQHCLESTRTDIRLAWEGLLRIERVSTPLANPDTLVHLIDSSLDEIFTTMRLWSPRRHPSAHTSEKCPCGRNPYLAYFAAGRQAMREALIMAQFQAPELSAAQRDESLLCLDQVFDRIANREISLFCTICQKHHAPERSTHTAAPCSGLMHLV